MKRILIFLFSVYLISHLTACTPQPIIDESFSVPNAQWSYKQVVDTTFVIKDIQNKYNVFFNLRNTNDYAFQNIYILFKMYPEDEKVPNNYTRFEFELANNDGTWLGSGSGAIYSMQLPLKTQYQFEKPGKYHIYIQQNMRENPLKGISDIGFSVEPSKE